MAPPHPLLSGELVCVCGVRVLGYRHAITTTTTRLGPVRETLAGGEADADDPGRSRDASLVHPFRVLLDGRDAQDM